MKRFWRLMPILNGLQEKFDMTRARKLTPTSIPRRGGRPNAATRRRLTPVRKEAMPLNPVNVVEIHVYRAGDKSDWTGWQRWRDFVAKLGESYPHKPSKNPRAKEDAERQLLAARLAARDLGWNGTTTHGFFATGTFPSETYIIGWESDISTEEDPARVTFFASSLPIPAHSKWRFLNHKIVTQGYSLGDLRIERSTKIRRTQMGEMP